jgi:NAD(P)-dependent dehydrogenase (short-subunit alcohol dehydrogenase family)
VICDVTKEADVENLAKETRQLLEKNHFKLWGGRFVCVLFADRLSTMSVINNAGIGNGGGIDWISTSTLNKVMDVNFYGVVRVTRAFLPMLKRTKDSRSGW